MIRGEQKLLRLSPDYGEMKIAIWKNRLAIGDDDGQVIVIELADSWGAKICGSVMWKESWSLLSV